MQRLPPHLSAASRPRPRIAPARAAGTRAGQRFTQSPALHPPSTRSAAPVVAEARAVASPIRLSSRSAALVCLPAQGPIAAPANDRTPVRKAPPAQSAFSAGSRGAVHSSDGARSTSSRSRRVPGTRSMDDRSHGNGPARAGAPNPRSIRHGRRIGTHAAHSMAPRARCTLRSRSRVASPVEYRQNVHNVRPCPDALVHRVVRCPGPLPCSARGPERRGHSQRPIGLVHYSYVLRREPCAQLHQQRFIEIDAPRFGQLDLPAGGVVPVIDNDRALAALVRLQQRQEAVGGT